MYCNQYYEYPVIFRTYMYIPVIYSDIDLVSEPITTESVKIPDSFQPAETVVRILISSIYESLTIMHRILEAFSFQFIRLENRKRFINTVKFHYKPTSGTER